MKRLAWIGLGVLVLLIVLFDNPWPRPGERGGPGVRVTTVPPSTTQLVLPSTPLGTP